MSFHRGPKTITNGLVLANDPADRNSYPGSGTILYDLSGNNGSAVLTNGPFFSNGTGDASGAIVYDGSNDGLVISNSTSLSALSVNTMTISSWNYASNYSQNGFMFEKTTNNTVNTQYSFFFVSDDRIIYRTYGLSTLDTTLTTSTSGVVNNQWNNLVATWDGTYKKIYVNGSLKSTSAALTGTITQNSTGYAYIGIFGNFGGYPFAGKIASTLVYNRALSDVEILQNFNALRGRFGI